MSRHWDVYFDLAKFILPLIGLILVAVGICMLSDRVEKRKKRHRQPTEQHVGDRRI